MSNPLISVVVAVYNTEKYVEKCISSILSQTYENIELILVDDGSTDNSGKICDSYAAKDSRVKVFHKKNGGSLSAKKLGVKNALGSYLTFIDSDDWLLNDTYEKVVPNLDDADIYAYGLTYVYSDNTEKPEINKFESGTYTGEKLLNLKNNALFFSSDKTIGIFGVMPSMCTKFYKRELISKYILKSHDSIRMGEDAVNTFPAIYESSKIIINNDIRGYMYRQEIEGAMTSVYRFIENDRIEKLFECLLDSFNSLNAECMIKQLPYYLAFLMRMQFVGELSHLSIKNIISKYKNIKYMYNLKWVDFVINNAEKSLLTDELKLFISCQKNPFMLFIKWYSKRIF